MTVRTEGPDAWLIRKGGTRDFAMRDISPRAMSAAMAGQEVRVSKLEWTTRPPRIGSHAYVATSLIGEYVVTTCNDAVYLNNRIVKGYGGKAGAQSHYDQTIRSALEPAGAREGAEDDMAATRHAAWKDTALIREASRLASAAREPAHGADEHRCPICAKPFKVDDICATDISEGICHAACLEGAPVVDLETGEETGGKADTYRYGDDAETER